MRRRWRDARTRRCCRSSAARSRRTASSPKRRSRELAPVLPGDEGARGRATRRCPAAICRTATARHGSRELARRYPALPRELLRALARRHGTRATTVLGDARAVADLGADFGAGLTEREIDYLRRRRMGADRGRHPVATHEMRAADDARAARARRRVRREMSVVLPRNAAAAGRHARSTCAAAFASC